MEENGNDPIGTIFMKEVARATPWGLMIIIVVLICLGFVTHSAKTVISYAQDNAKQTIFQIATDRHLIEGVKRNVREGIEYTFTKAGSEMKGLFKDAMLKQDIKEVVEYTFTKAASEARAVLRDPALKQDIKEALEYNGKHIR